MFESNRGSFFLLEGWTAVGMSLVSECRCLIDIVRLWLMVRNAEKRTLERGRVLYVLSKKSQVCLGLD
jgi:hypothetical protein